VLETFSGITAAMLVAWCALEDQDDFHIIAASNGGPDHADNYLYALGASFNRSIGNQLDAINCFLAGKAKAKKAVEISWKVALDRPESSPPH
jgi:hypothetical protein